ncbi:MAG: hypothetical protein R2737_17270 [Candidatus Nanopelagicales bacterium]
MPRSDVLAQLAALPGVAESAEEARREVDALLWDRTLRERSHRLVNESALRGARATAALDGADISLEALRSGAPLDRSPMGRLAAAALRVTAEVPAQVGVWGLSPMQVLARLHLVAAMEFAPEGSLGRPRVEETADDPLRLGTPPPAAEVAARLDSLATLLTRPTEAPALVVAAVAHGELLALRPFSWGSGLVARATVRLVLADRGVDPSLLVAPEVGAYALGRPSYVQALRGYASGTGDGVAQWLIRHNAMVEVAARESREVLASLH